ncbi:MAG TPA: alpha/beta hydrolase [Microbacterium sp.]|nr:alpha/beta hydrolase [Microbacterium sp.]
MGAAPVVLVHGVGMSHRYYARLQKVLARTRDVHAIDLPGFGSFGRPRTDFPPERMARGLAVVLERLGLSRAVLVGHSMGAQWVVELARQRPELVDAIVLIGPVVDVRHRSLRSQAFALASDALREPPLVNAILLADYVRCGIPWYSSQVRHMMRYPIEQRMSEVGAPALIIRGGGDPIAGLEWCRALRDRARHADLVLVPGRAHVVQDTAPRATASAIEAFLAGGRRARQAT